MRNTQALAISLFFLFMMVACSLPTAEETNDLVVDDTHVFQSLTSYGVPAELHLPASDANISLAASILPGTGQTIVKLNEDLHFWLRKESTSLDEFRTELDASPIFQNEYLPANKSTIFCKTKLPDGTTVTHHIIAQIDLAGEKWIARTDPSAELSGKDADWLLEVIQSIRTKAK